ncbi:MAG: hypothetical protein PHV82_03380, partial [Victivallaceae bacterium]|nr:hypothetical protein [Victivallaceae bacterium]
TVPAKIECGCTLLSVAKDNICPGGAAVGLSRLRKLQSAKGLAHSKDASHQIFWVKPDFDNSFFKAVTFFSLFCKSIFRRKAF